MGSRRLFFALAIAAGLILSVLWFGEWLYPYGVRHALLPSLRSGILAFAMDNDGWFPPSRTDECTALSALYPRYCNAKELSGVSGDTAAAAAELNRKGALSSNTTSWVYLPGFRDDDPKELAILWERSPGLYGTGGGILWRPSGSIATAVFKRPL